VDASLAQQLVAQLAGVRLALRKDLVPEAILLDDTDRRILAAMVTPRRLDQIWPLARTPRFRLLTFIYFLRHVGAVELRGVTAPARPPSSADEDARRLLGVDAGADRESVKRAYRRLARALHPDLHPSASSERRRLLERKLGEINAAYRHLLGE
jgi:DnaJ-domain-containing protein 1